MQALPRDYGKGVGLGASQHQFHFGDLLVQQGAEAEGRDLVSRKLTYWRRRSLNGGVVRLSTGYRLPG